MLDMPSSPRTAAAHASSGDVPEVLARAEVELDEHAVRIDQVAEILVAGRTGDLRPSFRLLTAGAFTELGERQDLVAVSPSAGDGRRRCRRARCRPGES